MTYASGGTIQASDYNGFVASVNAIWGTGSGDSGYGQSTTLSTVSAAVTTVTATQWSDLIARINTISQHQTGATSGMSGPSAGSTITYLSSLSGTISTLTTNRLTAIATGSATTTTVTNATGWTTTATKEVTLTWANASAMRYWFNAGGYVSFTGSASALAGNTKSTDWDSLLTACGATLIQAQSSGKSGGSGTPNTNDTNQGFHDLTTSYVTIMQQFSPTASGGYNLNNAQFQAKLNAAVGTATELSLKMILNDVAGDVVNDTVTGTVQLDYSYFPPSATYLSNVWGSVSVATVTNTQA